MGAQDIYLTGSSASTQQVTQVQFRYGLSVSNSVDITSNVKLIIEAGVKYLPAGDVERLNLLKKFDNNFVDPNFNQLKSIFIVGQVNNIEQFTADQRVDLTLFIEKSKSVFKKVSPELQKSIILKTSSSTDPVSFIVESDIINFSKSYITFKLSLAAGTYKNHIITTGGTPMMARIVVKDDKTKVILVDLPDISKYIALTNADAREYISKTSTTSTISLDKQYLIDNNDNTDTNVDYIIPLSVFKNTFFAQDYPIYSTSNIRIEVYFERTDNFAYNLNCNNTIPSNPISIVESPATCVTECFLRLAKENNDTIRQSVIEKVMDNNGMFFNAYLPTVSSDYSSAKEFSVSKKISKNTLEAVIIAPFKVGDARLINTHPIGSIVSYKTSINNEDQGIVDCIVNNDYYNNNNGETLEKYKNNWFNIDYVGSDDLCGDDIYTFSATRSSAETVCFVSVFLQKAVFSSTKSGICIWAYDSKGKGGEMKEERK